MGKKRRTPPTDSPQTGSPDTTTRNSARDAVSGPGSAPGPGHELLRIDLLVIRRLRRIMAPLSRVEAFVKFLVPSE